MLLLLVRGDAGTMPAGFDGVVLPHMLLRRLLGPPDALQSGLSRTLKCVLMLLRLLLGLLFVPLQCWALLLLGRGLLVTAGQP